MTMKKPQFEITPKKFYTIGKYSFFVVGLMGITNLIQSYATMSAPTIVSTIANAVFYFTMAGFFSYLQKKEDVKEISEGDMIRISNAIDKELNAQGGNNAIIQEKRNAKK